MRKFNRWTAVAMAALIALLVGTGSAAAGSLITSAKIKNGTIKLEDISSSARAALKGNQGPVGATGAQGAQGVSGLAGAQGLSGGFDPAKVSYITGPEASIPSGANGTTVAKCPVNTKVIGGGSLLGYATGNITVEMTAPLADGSGWIAGFANDGQIVGKATAYAVCAAK